MLRIIPLGSRIRSSAIVISEIFFLLLNYRPHEHEGNNPLHDKSEYSDNGKKTQSETSAASNEKSVGNRKRTLQIK